ncbi:hypothetical protein [Kocuria tytonis]|uniref:hypothetical protein n=1 Tax=Kocuria tytonis TaxID=2054280 RepID=UPI001314510C|nr:hypothetical protein [Kocuria tytonis]
MRSSVWLPRSVPAAALTAALSLCLVACGHEPERAADRPATPAASSADPGLRPGTFRANLPSGATVRISIPAPRVPDDSLDRLRHDARVARATYATVEIDNRKGRSPVSASRLILTARDGATYQLEHVSRAVERWRPRSVEDEYRAPDGATVTASTARGLQRRISEAADHAAKDVPVGERGRNILVGDITRIPDSFASLELVPLIGDREVAPVRARSEDRGGGTDDGGSPSAGTDGNRPGRKDDAAGADDALHGGIPLAPVPEEPRATPESPGDAPVAPVDPADPVAPGPAVPDPVAPGPVVPTPVVPVVPGPVVPGPVVPDPVVPGPVVPPPVVPDPVVPDPVVPPPVVPDPVVPPPVVPDPVVPVPPESEVTDPGVPGAVG